MKENGNELKTCELDACPRFRKNNKSFRCAFDIIAASDLPRDLEMSEEKKQLVKRTTEKCSTPLRAAISMGIEIGFADEERAGN